MMHARSAAAAFALAASLLTGCAMMPASAPAMVADGVLTGANGMTLYVFDRDAGGKSACNGPCTANWPPLMAADSASASGDYSVIVRDDGKKQYAYKGKPLYYWSKDTKAGDKTGDGFNSVWHTAKP
jgi:predicted lipoprotein with Yx(FWY)xxD motif